MVAWLVVLVACVGSGISVVLKLGLFKEKGLVAGVGALLGLTVYTTLAYLFSIPFDSAKIGCALALMAPLLAFLWARHDRKLSQEWKQLGLDRGGVWVFGVTFLLYLPISLKLFFDREGAFWTGIVSALGDVTWHVATTTSFAEGQAFPPDNPIFSGHPLVYPFLVNFLSGGSLAWGATLPTAMNVPAVILLPLLATLYYFLVREYSGRPKVAALSTLFLLLAGSVVGWFRIVQEFRVSPEPWYLVPFHFPYQDFSGSGASAEGLHFVNPVVSLILPQRSFLFGLPIAFCLLLLWGKGKDKASALVAGLLAGMLPLFHAHTALALIPSLILVTPKPRWKMAPWALGAAALFGIPEGIYFLALGPMSSHFSVKAFWMAEKTNALLFWLRNCGVVFLVSALALKAPVKKELKQLALAGLVLFVLGNSFQFARWIWDNYKIFYFAWIFAVPAAVALGVQWQEAGGKGRAWALGILIGLHLISGALDTWKVLLPTSASFSEFDAGARAVAERIRAATPKGSRLVQGTSYNTPAVLTGRRTYLGYTAHVWSHGWEPASRETELKRLFAGEMASPTDMRVDYALVGPQERVQFPHIKPHPAWRLLFSQDGYDVYRLPD